MKNLLLGLYSMVEGNSIMCKAMEVMRNESWKEGKTEGKREEKNLTVLRMLEIGKYALEEIAAVSGLSLEEIKKLQAGVPALFPIP